MKTKIILGFLLAYTVILGQANITLNQHNEKGKKHGYWKTFFDDKITPTDSVNSVFFAYQLFDNGETVYMYGDFREKKKLNITYPRPLPAKGKPYLLNGKFIWRDKDSTLLMEEYYSDGFPQQYCIYQMNKNKNLVISEEVDFTRKFDNMQGSFYSALYFMNSDGALKFWYRKGKRRWNFYRIR